jgi:hypothetical protein
MDRRRKRFAKGSVFQVHVEKMGRISQGLVTAKLAREGKYPWCEVEKDTADDFMSYLATTLGQQKKVDSDPVTDNEEYLRRLARAGVMQSDMARQLDALRVEVLDAVLPIPNHVIAPDQLRAFKERHQRELGDFRQRVEGVIIDAAAISDLTLRERKLALFTKEARGRIAEIQEAMRGAGWRTVKAGLAVVAAIPGVSQLFGLANAVWDAVSSGHQPKNARDFAYAAYAKVELVSKPRRRTKSKRKS